FPPLLGKPYDGERLMSKLPDHPHACGENREALAGTHRRIGPSPRVWGKLDRIQTNPDRTRTIPTRVGKTKPGQHIWISRHGPSPRVWGKPCDLHFSTANNRTIPTRVGKTPVRWLVSIP